MTNELLSPDYVFEASWEVCNKVGGIYTVLSTHAKTLQEKMRDRIFFIGPDIWAGKDNPLFIESDNLCAAWRQHAAETDGLKVRVGRWDVPGKPIAILVDFQPFFASKNEIYGDMWNSFGVDSLHAYGDYDESCMFAYATGRVVESFYRYNLTEMDKVVFQAHEWMTGMGALYVRKRVPQVATVFTTHATSIGRSIAGNNKPLYDYLFAYNGDQMAQELNMQSKHSVEKQTAHNVDCFTTVSEITNHECLELLEKQADVILMNGFENDFVPQGETFVQKRRAARRLMVRVAECLLGQEIDEENTLMIGTSGRYEFRNKGIDVFLEAMNRLNREKSLKKNVLAFVSVPGWVGSCREDLLERMAQPEGTRFDTPLHCPYITHWLHNMTHDQVLDMLKYLGMDNGREDRVKVIFVPCYLDGKDGIFNKPYYDLIVGNDLSIYPSYYEPWGYTPLESVAFHVPTITTDLAGFGLWVKSLEGQDGIADGVEVLHRSDYNYSEVADGIKDTVSIFSGKSAQEVTLMRERAASVAEKALWKYFIRYYYQAYDLALRKAAERQKVIG